MIECSLLGKGKPNLFTERVLIGGTIKRDACLDLDISFNFYDYYYCQKRIKINLPVLNSLRLYFILPPESAEFGTVTSFQKFLREMPSPSLQPHKSFSTAQKRIRSC